MKNSVLYIIGAVALLGGGALVLFLKNKSKKDELFLADLKKKELENKEPKSTPQASQDVISANDLLAITKLKDEILANIRRKGTYRKQGSRDAVQRDIDQQLIELKKYGFAIGINNQLVNIK